jgi:transposase
VVGACKPRHRHQEFLAFLKQVSRAYPEGELHLVMDNDATHKNHAAHKKVEIRDWLMANPRRHVHFTPTSGSWLNLVEIWFGIIERQAIRCASFGSVKDLNTRIRAFIDGRNDRCHPSRLDQDRRADPQESQPSDHLKHGPLTGIGLTTTGTQCFRKEGQVGPVRVRWETSP